MSEEEYKALVDDIKKNGLIDPIVVHEGKIIDGRHRFKACMELGIELSFVQWNEEGSLVDFVTSKNAVRRHLTASQKAAVAVMALSHYQKEAKERMSLGGKGVQKIAHPSRATERAAKAFGTNRRYVEEVKRIKEKSLRKFKEIYEGKKTISQVKQEIESETEYRETEGVTPGYVIWMNNFEDFKASMNRLFELLYNPSRGDKIELSVEYLKKEEVEKLVKEGKLRLISKNPQVFQLKDGSDELD